MKIRELASKSTVLIAGMVNKENDCEKIKLIIKHNFELLSLEKIVG